MTKFKGLCLVDNVWREGYPVDHPSGWVGIQVLNSDSACYTVYRVHPDTWQKVQNIE